MDCIEFSHRLRCGDIASDAAFLAMDLEFRGHRREADEFTSFYLERSGDDATLPVVFPFYRTYRAYVRGKVDSMLAAEHEVPEDERADAGVRARRYFELAQKGARPVPRALVMMVGLSGSGKSWVARALAARVGAAIVGTDAVRRGRSGTLPGHTDYETGAYAPERRDEVYRELIERSRLHLSLKRSVVLDGTFIKLRHRLLAYQLAEAVGVPVIAVLMTAPESVVRERLAARGDGELSDARWDTYVAQRDGFEAPGELPDGHLLTLDSGAPLHALVDQVAAVLLSQSGHSAGH
jgi:hypothetical protein